MVSLMADKPRRGSALLLEWREKLRLKQQQACAIVGIDATLYSRIEGGVRVPRLEVALRIAERTGNAVPVESWRSA